MIVADALAQHRCQGIRNHHADSTVIMVSQTSQNLFGFYQTEEGFGPDSADFKGDGTQEFYLSYSANVPTDQWIPLTKGPVMQNSDVCFLVLIGQTVELSVSWDTLTVMWYHCNGFKSPHKGAKMQISVTFWLILIMFDGQADGWNDTMITKLIQWWISWQTDES